MKYDLIYKKLKEQINSANGDYYIGDKLPTEQQLSVDFSVSRSTVRKVIHQLNQDGMIECVQGKGHFIRQKKSDLVYPLSKTENIFHHQEKINIIKYQVMTVPASVAQSLDLSINDKVYFINRLVFKEYNPLKIQEIFLPCKRFPTLSYGDMGQSIMDVMKKYQPQTQMMSRLHFMPSIADSQQAELLKVNKGKLLQQIISVITCVGNLSLGYMITTYCVDQNSFSFVCPDGID